MGAFRRVSSSIVGAIGPQRGGLPATASHSHLLARFTCLDRRCQANCKRFAIRRGVTFAEYRSVPRAATVLYEKCQARESVWNVAVQTFEPRCHSGVETDDPSR